MIPFKSTITFLALFIVGININGQVCYVDSMSTSISLDSLSAIYDYNGIRPENYAGLYPFSNGSIYLDDKEALFHFTASGTATELTFDRNYLQFNGNNLPSQNFINLQIGNNPLIATTTDSLNHHLSVYGYSATVLTNPGSATDFQNITITGPVFSKFYIGTGEGSTLGNICVNATLEITEEKFDFTISPNPNTGIFTLNCSATNPTTIIYDCIGDIIYESTNQLQHVNISHLSSGVYLVQVTSNLNSAVKKIIIE